MLLSDLTRGHDTDHKVARISTTLIRKVAMLCISDYGIVSLYVCYLYVYRSTSLKAHV